MGWSVAEAGWRAVRVRLKTDAAGATEATAEAAVGRGLCAVHKGRKGVAPQSAAQHWPCFLGPAISAAGRQADGCKLCSRVMLCCCWVWRSGMWLGHQQQRKCVVGGVKLAAGVDERVAGWWGGAVQLSAGLWAL